MRTIFTLIILCFAGQCIAQQEVQFTMTWNNYSLLNPAATGLFNKHFASVCGRHQWVDFGGEPRMISAVYDFKWAKMNSGAGLNYVYEMLGFEINQKINFNYSYQLNFKNERILSSGIAFGLSRKCIDFSNFIALDPTDPLLASNSKKADFSFNLNYGVLYKTPHYVVGLSVTDLNQSQYESLSYRNKRHYFLSCTYNANVGKKFILRPNVFIKSDLSSTQYDINLLALYKKRYWAGLTYRRSDAIAIMAGMDIKGKYRIGYSYDITTSELKNYSKGSHEVVIAFMTD